MAIAGLIFDIDGTILRGDVLMRGVGELLPALRQRGLRLAFLTNDNGATIADWMKRLEPLGVQPDELTTSAIIAADIVARQHVNKSVMPIGDAGLMQAMEQAALKIVQDGADVVVMGNDPAFDQQRLNLVCQQIWNGAAFVATNADRKLPVADGYVPATGAMVQAVAYATGVQPTIVGKPSLYAAEVVLRRMGLEAENVVMVGDSLTSDIKMGNAAGMRTVLVLTGTSSRADVARCSADMRPDTIINDLTELIPTLWGGRE